MPRKRRREPFFREARGQYYVIIGKKEYALGPDKDAAWKEYHRLMSAETTTVAEKITFREVVDRFLAWTKANPDRSRRTWELYNGFFQTILRGLPAGLLVADLKVHHVTKLLEDNASRWPSGSSKRVACTAIKAAINWAHRQEIIAVQPLAGMEMPVSAPRELWYEDDEWQAILESVPGPAFRDLLTIMRETGCRPFEAKGVTKANFEPRERRWLFKRKDSKGKRYNRRVLLSDVAFDMTQKAALKYPTGPIFRNERGEPWTKSMLAARTNTVERRTGIKLIPYAIRHTFAAQALRNGVDALYVAELMGHRDLTMVARVYGHIGSNAPDMHKRLKQALAPASSVVAPSADVQVAG
jgi:integrase